MKSVFTLTLLLFITNSFAQMGGGYYPDSLQTVTLKGYVVIDSSLFNAIYFLDETNDGTEDYRLNFGPQWYSPENSDAVRPADGELVTITGGLIDSSMTPVPSVIVYEIDGQFWRNPYDPFWNHMGEMGRSGGMMDSCFNSGFGWRHDSLVSIRIAGNIMLDSTFVHPLYYLDYDNNLIPDYFLNFGPPWYNPVSLAVRPDDNDEVVLTGGLIDNGTMPMIVVYTLNGKIWRDSANFMGYIGGGWIHQDINQTMRFNTPFDEMDWMEVAPDWHQGMQDSLFCQILETFPGSVYQSGNENAFAAYEVNFFSPGMMGGGMQSGMSCGGNMQFNNVVSFQFHYTDSQVNSNNISEQTIQVKGWDPDADEWALIPTFALDTSNNIISFGEVTISNFYILTGSSPTGIENETEIIKSFTLEQNYPNPFNPVTIIRWQLPEAGNAELKIFDLLGREILTLVNEYKQAGTYETELNAAGLPSGIYFYRLKSENNIQIRKMVLMK